MNLSAQPLHAATSYPNFQPAEFDLPIQSRAENFTDQKLHVTAKITAANDSPVDETWAPVTAFLDTMQEAVSGVDEYLCVKYWNTPMVKLTGVTRDEAMHRPLFSLLPRDFERHLEAGLRHLFKQKPENAEIIAGEFSQSHGNSDFFDFSYRMRALPAMGNRGLVIISLRPAPESRSQRLKEQPRPFDLLGQLSAGIARELAEPLNTICSRIDNIVSLTGNHWNEDLEAELHGIITEVYRLSYLVNNILTLSNHGAASFEPVDINHLIPEALTLLEHTLNRQIACVTALQEDLPLVPGDPLLLQSVLQNMLRYAVEAAGEDAVPRVQTSLFMQASTNGRMPAKTNGKAAAPLQHVVIRIEDRGATMTPNILAQLFDPLSCSKRFGIAAGLGLFISKKIIESHGGQIHVSSEPGHGTIFTMAFKI